MENQRTNSDQSYYVVYYDTKTNQYGNPVLVNTFAQQKYENQQMEESKLIEDPTHNNRQQIMTQKKEILLKISLQQSIEKKIKQFISSINLRIRRRSQILEFSINHEENINEHDFQKEYISIYATNQKQNKFIEKEKNVQSPQYTNQKLIENEVKKFQIDINQRDQHNNQNKFYTNPIQIDPNFPSNSQNVGQLTQKYRRLLEFLSIRSIGLKDHVWKDPITQYNYAIDCYNSICEKQGQQKLDKMPQFSFYTIWFYFMVFFVRAVYALKEIQNLQNYAFSSFILFFGFFLILQLNQIF